MNYILAWVCFGVGLFFLREAVMVWRSAEFRRDVARLREQRAREKVGCDQRADSTSK